MRRIDILLIVVISIIGFVLQAESFAQGGMCCKGSRGWGKGSQYNRMYNPATVETIIGEVVSVDRVTPMKGMSYGVHIMVKTDKETIPVHVGPGWYLENQDTKIESGDKVEVTGSKVNFEDKPTIIAKEVKKGDQILNLRDENGFPVWAGWRKR